MTERIRGRGVRILRGESEGKGIAVMTCLVNEELSWSVRRCRSFRMELDSADSRVLSW